MIGWLQGATAQKYCISISSVTILVGVLSGCGRDATSAEAAEHAPSAATAEPSGTLFADGVQSTDLGIVGPLRTLGFEVPASLSNVTSVELLYVDAESNDAYLQTAWRESVADEFKVLVPPIAVDKPIDMKIVLDPYGVAVELGDATLLPLPLLEQPGAPGIYTQLGMDSLLFELRRRTEALAALEGSDGGVTQQQVDILKTAAAGFQETIQAAHDASAFNSPVVDPATGSTFMTGADYALLDRLFLTLERRLSVNGLLFDDNAGLSADEIDRLTASFAEFAEAVSEFVADDIGRATVGSLIVRRVAADGDEKLSRALGMFEAALIPVMLSNALERAGTVVAPDAAALDDLQQASALFSRVAEQTGYDHFVFKRAVETMQSATAALSGLL